MWGHGRLLKDNKDVVLAGKTQAQVFIPLCGKAHELKCMRRKRKLSTLSSIHLSVSEVVRKLQRIILWSVEGTIGLLEISCGMTRPRFGDAMFGRPGDVRRDSEEAKQHLVHVEEFVDLGHRVVGVEFIEDCVREYFAENDLKLRETTCPVIGCKILQVRMLA
ncbi:hypothetical protein HPB52_009038 [Rhipicephalus sanguineus]|uniref:Thiopurine S-methyltransferase n=1 Tax=Rhipicephalus sanguineus TaxID=34632 RepID=A0A9D4T5L7_RHISA|nr:hypothetical protein HPB52_009038 [Rhipicephalus sanguineus]